MEIILNQIREGLQSIGLPYISQFETLLILLTVLTILVFVLWIVLRRMKLWYWKTDIQIDTLKNIDNHLAHIGETLSKNIEAADSETQLQSENIDPLNQETVPEAAPEGEFDIGRSGKVYTEAELELLIRE
ncbi:MAG: hypothetical protein PHE79_04655 [Eubacteriales bacterium]|nr:hypothetical protein [Eubacteriales bacterium]